LRQQCSCRSPCNGLSISELGYGKPFPLNELISAVKLNPDLDRMWDSLSAANVLTFQFLIPIEQLRT
jgi:hypothetical protein